MRFDELIKMIKNEFNKVSVPTFKMTHKEKERETKTISTLNKLLETYQNNNDVIDKQELLEPFYIFLRNRIVDSDHGNNLSTKINVYCKILDNGLKIAMQGNDDSLETLASNFIQQINNVDFHTINNNILIHIESCYALYKLKTLLEKITNKHDKLDQNHLDLFMELFKKRWEIIEDTEVDYVNNKDSSANKIYLNLACNLAEKAKENNLKEIDHILLLMPKQNFIFTPNNNDKVKKFIYEILFRDDEQSAQLKSIISNLKITEKQFAKELIEELNKVKKSIFLELKRLKNDESHIFSLFIENIQSILEIENYLLKINNSHRLIDLKTIRPFISWLEERWKWIHQTPASYNSTLKSKLNDFAKDLANFIVLTSYQTAFSNKNPEKLLMKFKENGPISGYGEQLLNKNIVKRTKSFDNLINTMLMCPAKKWQNFMNLFDYQDLIKFAAPNMNKEESFPKFFKKINLFNDNENHNKAVLFVFLEIYAKKRQEGEKYNTRLAPFINYVHHVPSREEKLKVVNHIKDNYLVKSKPLSQYISDLDDPLSSLYQYKNIITDGKFKKYVKQIKKAFKIRNESHEEQNKQIII